METLKDFEYIETVTQKYAFEGDRLTMDISASIGYSLQMLGEMVKTSEATPLSSDSAHVAESAHQR